jgi:hypothetical protein
MFLEQVVFCAKKAVDGRQKDQMKILKRLNKELHRLTQETNLSFGTVQLILKNDLHFFPIVCLLCMKLPLDISAILFQNLAILLLNNIDFA